MKSEAVLRGVSALAVRCLAESECHRWDRFVAECPEATFFHQSGWARVIEEVFGYRTYFLYAERSARIEGVLPLAFVDSWLTGRALVSLPFCIEAGVAAISVEARAALEREALLIAAQLGVAHLEIRSRGVHQPDWPTQDLYVRFEKPILPEAADNLAAIPRKQRAVVRKGQAAGLVARRDEVSRFHALYADNMRRHGSPAHGQRYFEKLCEVFGDQCRVLTVADARGVALSSVMSFYFRDTVLPYYAGDVAAARESHANDFKYWALMDEARVAGCTVFDYGRSKVGSGSFSFKKNWGCEPQPLYYQYQFLRGQRAVPEHNPNNPKYRFLIAAWRRLPLPLTRILGPRVARHFP